ncbi:MAG: amidotransferase 1, exosortase A system-associated [Acidobacteria bacterium]|nr:amidotransferase 1, exosortase A system-associated [Acidobacteriota bacterium]
MCGICGFLYFDNRPVDSKLAERMSDVQKHRGPDQSGVYSGPGIALAHRRLSIIDLASGRQPLSNENEKVWITYNGEIYNFEDLNRMLAGKHRFRTRCDTETIVHLYEQYPEDFVSMLRGMFAFAVWDESAKTLILARDRVGKKPLYYYLDNEKLVFASEIKSLLSHGNLDLEIDQQSVSDYISLGYIPAPKSIYRRIRKVRPGHYLKVTGQNVREICYWDIRFREDNHPTEAEWIEQFLEQFEEAIRIRFMSEVPLGAFLSGGVDSSAVVAMMSRIMDQPVRTATIGFNEDKFDESGYAREIAKFLQTDHYERTVTPDKIGVIEKLVWHYDEPYSDSSALPTYYVSKVARECVTVALSGDGGDENFAGYRRYLFDVRENKVRRMLPYGFRKWIFGPLGMLYPKMDWAPRVFRARSTFQSLSYDPVEGYFETMSIFRRDDKAQILSRDLTAGLKDYSTRDVFRSHYNSAGTDDPLSRIQYLDIKTYLTDDILTKVDRASMAVSLEVRCPLLDHKLMELLARMPSSLKLRGSTGKHLFKKAMESYLPGNTINRTKMGFGVPLAEWFRSGIRDFARAYIIDREDPFLSGSFISKIWKQHQSGVRDRSSQLWNVLMFRLWMERFGTTGGRL